MPDLTFPYCPFLLCLFQSKGSKKHDASEASSLPANDTNDLDMSMANDGDDFMEDYEEVPDIQSGIKEVSNQVTKSLSLNNITSSKMSDVQGLNAITDQQSSTSSEVGFALSFRFSSVCMHILFIYLFFSERHCMEYLGSETLWTHQLLHGCGKRYTIHVWWHDGSQRSRNYT